MSSLSSLRTLIKKVYVNMFLDPKTVSFRNDEGLADFNFDLLPRSQHRAGISAMLRVKNEADMIEACITSIAPVFDEIIVVDNGSTDSTAEIVRGLTAQPEYSHVKLFSYPHTIARLGDEHQSTAETSVHSLAYFYNWCLSQCGCQWIFKWDGDMVLPKERADEFISMLNECTNKEDACWVIRGKTIYIGTDGTVYSPVPEEVNGEDMLFPNRPWLYYRKDQNWETLKGDVFVPSRHPKPWFFWEVKDVRKDEFAHWSDDIDFSTVSVRKAREFKNYTMIKNQAYGEGEVTVVDFVVNS